MKRPNGRVNLVKALHRIFPDDVEFSEMQGLIANVLVGQFLPDGVVKGGASLKLRYGNLGTRVTTDLDASHKFELDEFISAYANNLKPGWEGFTFELIRRKPASPKNLNPQYVMQPFEVKISYNGKAWTTVYLELSGNEIGDADVPEFTEPPMDVVVTLARLGFPCPGKLPLMPLEHQIAQKLHGLTELNSERAHDLIDIQLIMRNSNIDLDKMRGIAEKLFHYRKMQQWPSRVVKQASWASLYTAASWKFKDLLPLDEAIEWVNTCVIGVNQ